MTCWNALRSLLACATAPLLRLGRTGAGRPRPSADLYRSGDLRRRDDAHLRRRPGSTSPTKARFRTRTTSSPPSSGLRPLIVTARQRRHDPRALQPLHPSRHDAVPLGQGQRASRSSAPITAGISSTTASCAACHGRTAMPKTCPGSEVQSRAGAARRILSRLHLRHAQHGCAAAARTSRSDHEADRRVARPQSRRQGRGLRGQPAQIQGQLEARLRQFRRRLSRRCFRTARCWRRRTASPTKSRKGHVLLQDCARRAADVHAVHGQRPSLQGQAAQSARARLAGCGRSSRCIPAWSMYEQKLRAQFGDRADALLDLAGSEPVNINVFPNLSLLGNHIQVFEPMSSTKPTRSGTAPGSWTTTGRSARMIEPTSMRCACARRRAFPNFGEVDDLANFEQIQRGLRMPGGRVDLHAPRPGHSRPHSAPSRTARSRRRRPTKCSCANISRNGSA